jgi:hypothetical protein
MCKICEAMPENQKYVSPYAKNGDVFNAMTMEQLKRLTKRSIDAIVVMSRQLTADEQREKTGQTSLF